MKKLTVLQSFPVPRPTTNPYLVMLQDSLRQLPDAEVLNFSWRTALRANYDVFHVHWPEILVDGRTPLRKAARQFFTAALLLRLAWNGTPVVRTMHNVNPPDGIGLRAKLLLQAMDRQTRLRIALNAETSAAAGIPQLVIPHGDYREWFARFPAEQAMPGRIAYVGLIRRYKGVEVLMAAFRGTERLMPGLSLQLAGKPSTPELRRTMERLAANDPRIQLRLDFLPDGQLVKAITSAEMIVLPYRFMHNSGATLAALSLGRPVLVPDNPVNRMLREEVGPGWVYTFDGELEAEHIVRAVQAHRADPAAAPLPVFGGRDWARAGGAHLRAYRLAVGLAGAASVKTASVKTASAKGVRVP